MIITAWILLVFFGFISLQGLYKLLFSGSLNWFHALVWMFSIFVSAISAGYIWG